MKALDRLTLVLAIAASLACAGCGRSAPAKPRRADAAKRAAREVRKPSAEASKRPAPKEPAEAPEKKRAAWQIARATDIETTTTETETGVSVEFTKSGTGRRLLAMTMPIADKPQDIASIALRYRLDLESGETPRLAAVVWQSDGGAFFAISPQSPETGREIADGIPLQAASPATFSESAANRVDWNLLEEVWLGLVMDGPAKGRFEVIGAELSATRWRPSRPVELSVGAASDWQLGIHQAVKATVNTTADGDNDRPAMTLEFTGPGHEHIWITATKSTPTTDLSAFHGLRFRAKARVPAGLRLLVTLTEADGEQHYHEPPPPPAGTWETITIPFTTFKHAGWSKRVNGTLEPNAVRSLTLGMHGAAEGDSSAGELHASGIVYVPSAE